MRGLPSGPRTHEPTDVDKIVGDYAEGNPALHSDIGLVAAAIETISPLDHADAPLAAGAPFLAVAEPALLLLAFALGALARPIGNAHALNAHRFCSGLVPGGGEPAVGRHQARHAPQLGLVDRDRRNQQIGVIGPSSVDLVINNDLILGFLQFHHLSALVWLASFAFANDLG